MSRPTYPTPLDVRIPVALRAKLELIAEEEGKSVKALVLEAARQRVDQYEPVRTWNLPDENEG